MAFTDWITAAQGTNVVATSDNISPITGAASYRVENFVAEVASAIVYPTPGFTNGLVHGRIRTKCRRTGVQGIYFMASALNILSSGSCYYVTHPNPGIEVELRKTTTGINGNPGTLVASFILFSNAGAISVLEVNWFGGLPAFGGGTRIDVRYDVDVPDFSALPLRISTLDANAPLVTSSGEGLFATNAGAVTWDTEFDETTIWRRDLI